MIDNKDDDEAEEEYTEMDKCEICFSFEKITKHHAIPKLVLKRLRK